MAKANKKRKHRVPENDEVPSIPPVEETAPPADENLRHEEFADHESDLEGDVPEPGETIEPDEDEPKASHSVVADKFKDRYIANAKEHGLKGKAARRSNWDWLAQNIAGFCLSDKGKIDINKFISLLDANEVNHSKWTNRNRGWEGRFRMTGRVALQRIVADTGILRMPDSPDLPAPADFVEKYKTKE